MSRALAFSDDGRPLDYGRRLSRLRWRRAANIERCETWNEADEAGPRLAGADEWMLVLDPDALPAFRSLPQAPGGKALAASWARPDEAVHTLRELEGARVAPLPPARDRPPAAIVFRASDAPSRAVSVEVLIERLLGEAAVDPAFLAVGFEVASERERPELTRRLPDRPLRILDAGCGAGSGIAAAKARCPGWTVTGIERDPDLAARARARCDRVLEGDLRAILSELERAGERFDAVVFADVLEHLADPIAALSAARRIAAPGGASLLVSVPNVGHLSVVRDLIAGRFDPVPAGLVDVHHLRWFTRESLARAVEESGWRIRAIEAERGAPPPSPDALRNLAGAWPEADPESLEAYQWVATADA